MSPAQHLEAQMSSSFGSGGSLMSSWTALSSRFYHLHEELHKQQWEIIIKTYNSNNNDF